MTNEELDKLRTQFTESGINMAALEQAAKEMMKDPLLVKRLKEQLKNNAFKKNVDELYKEIEDIFDHGGDSNV